MIPDYKPGEIWIIPRVMVEPPSFWEDENPDEPCRDFSGKSVRQSYSSDIWFRDTEKAMTACLFALKYVYGKALQYEKIP